MSSIRRSRTIYIVEPVLNDSGISNNVKGYDNLVEYINFDVVPAYSTNDVAMYGNSISDVMKFHKKQYIELDSRIRYGIYLDNEPTIDTETNLYQNPSYVTTQVLHYGTSTLIDAEKQIY